MDQEQIKKSISYLENRKCYDEEIAKVRFEKEQHIKDISDVYDRIISEKEKEAYSICGAAPECMHDITFVFPTIMAGGTPIHTHVEKCIVCNCYLPAMSSSKYRIYYKGNKVSIYEKEADEIIEQMRAVLSQITNFDDMDKVIEALNGVMEEKLKESR